MMEKKELSAERLYKIRRLRKARRLFKQAPLFAYQMMLAEHSQYRYEDFLDDLRRRTMRKPKAKKSGLSKYGRYNRMCKLLLAYSHSRDIGLLIQAQKLKRHMTKPYRVLFRFNAEQLECTFPATISIQRIEELLKNSKACKTIAEIEELVARFRGLYGNIN